jgi:hypothetical protein
MYMTRKVTDSVAYDFFFLLTVIVGSFFVLNLMIAVQFTHLLSSLEENEKELLLEKQRKKDARKELADDKPKETAEQRDERFVRYL